MSAEVVLVLLLVGVGLALVLAEGSSCDVCQQRKSRLHDWLDI